MLMAILSAMPLSARQFTLTGSEIETTNVDTHVVDNYMVVTADIVLDNLNLKTNHQVMITPIICSSDSSDSKEKILPSVLVSGRNMHISYERGVLRGFELIREKDSLLNTSQSPRD